MYNLITKEQIHEWEIRLNSNIYFLQEFIRNEGNMMLGTTPEEVENGQPEYLSDIVKDLEDIRADIEIEELKF